MNDHCSMWLRSASLRAKAKRFWRLYARFSVGGVRHRPLLDIDSNQLRILDVGCGGGIPWLTEFGHVTGIDIEANLLVQASQHYQTILQHNIAEPFPFPNSQFDLLLMNDVVAHVPDETLSNAFREIARVMRPSGKVIAACECYAGGIFEFVRRYPDVFQAECLDRPGHQFIQPYAGLSRMIEASGLTVDQARFCIPAPGSLACIFDNYEHGDPSMTLGDKVRLGLSRMVHRYCIVQEIVNVLWQLYDWTTADQTNSPLVVLTLRRTRP
jgi:SAM-dependent methyltransferase